MPDYAQGRHGSAAHGQAVDQFVLQHLAGVSRTYAIVIPMLPAELAEPVGLAYLLLRIIDTLEDTPGLDAQLRCRLLAELRRSLEADAAAAGPPTQPLGQTEAERALMRDLPLVLARIRAMQPLVRKHVCRCAVRMIDGLREFFDRSAQRGQPYPAIRNLGEMRQYCYYVAGIVGEMLCELLASHLGQPRLSRLRPLAVELGIGLQMVNIVKDYQTDAQKGRRYLPADNRPAADLCSQVADEARRRLSRGVEFVMALPTDEISLRLFCGLPLAWGALTLAQVRQDGRHTKISRSAIADSIEQFRRLAADDQALRAWLFSLLGTSPGDSRADSTCSA
jgi:farnesyl-diphosphate farnesyltransferase